MTKKIMIIISLIIVLAVSSMVYFLNSDPYFSEFKKELASVSDNGKVVVVDASNKGGWDASTSEMTDQGKMIESFLQFFQPVAYKYKTKTLSFEFRKQKIHVVYRNNSSVGSSAMMPGSTGSWSSAFFVESKVDSSSKISDVLPGIYALSAGAEAKAYLSGADIDEFYLAQDWLAVSKGKSGLLMGYHWDKPRVEDYSGDNKNKITFFREGELVTSLKRLSEAKQ